MFTEQSLKIRQQYQADVLERDYGIWNFIFRRTPDEFALLYLLYSHFCFALASCITQGLYSLSGKTSYRQIS